MRKLTLIFYLILIGAIVYLGACLAITSLREATLAALSTVSVTLADGFAAVTTPIATSPIYLQWNWLIWLCIGWFTLGIGVMLWHRRPKMLGGLPKTVTAQAPMGEPQTIIIRETPVSTSTKSNPEPLKKEEPKQEATAE